MKWLIFMLSSLFILGFSAVGFGKSIENKNSAYHLSDTVTNSSGEDAACTVDLRRSMKLDSNRRFLYELIFHYENSEVATDTFRFLPKHRRLRKTQCR
jgi:hypothetical protein